MNMSYNYKTVPVRAHKSKGEELAQSMFYVLIYVVIYYILANICKAIAAPFKYLFWSDEKKLNLQIEKAKAKASARDARYEAFQGSDSNMLEGALLRELHPENFRNDKDLDMYKDWLKTFQSGAYLDSGMWYAPSVLCRNAEYEQVFSEEFLDYLNHQVDLHVQHGTFAERHEFLDTIGKYFPEFTPKLSVISIEIESLRERVMAQNLRIALRGAIKKLGLNDEQVDELMKEDNPETLRKDIATIKKCLGNGLNGWFGMYCVHTDFNPDTYKNKSLLKSMCTVLSATNGNEAAVTAVLNGRMTTEELTAILQSAVDMFSDREDMVKYVDDKVAVLIRRKTLASASH